jgi:hypothetical protein
VIANQALLRAIVAPHGLPLGRCEFEYGRTTDYGHTVSCSLTSTSSALAATAVALALSPATEYHFRLIAATAVGSVTGKDEHFTTPQLPSVAPVHVSLQLRRLSNRLGLIGQLVAIHAFGDLAPGETVRVTCALDCTPHRVLSAPVGSVTTSRGLTLLPRPVALGPTTQIQVAVSAGGELSRYVRFAFSLRRTQLASRVLQTGCLSVFGVPISCRSAS